ncbi:alpha/beta hydrolase [Psittacicella hinzii]|uniref:alpha/beta hydrolase n=1 Tax=Psittacicella hinzii TaxID=2028575 RepID=UPI001FE3C16F|nr:alpha/beta hydrolase [Psittacicella hinzii]
MPLNLMNVRLMSFANEIQVPTLVLAGEKAHSRYFAEDAFKLVGSKDKELVIVPGANHAGLYDTASGQLPLEKFANFFNTKLHNK